MQYEKIIWIWLSRRTPFSVTVLNPIIGYEKAAKIAKKAYKEKRSIIDVAAQETDLSREDLKKILVSYKLTRGGIA